MQYTLSEAILRTGFELRLNRQWHRTHQVWDLTRKWLVSQRKALIFRYMQIFHHWIQDCIQNSFMLL